MMMLFVAEADTGGDDSRRQSADQIPTPFLLALKEDLRGTTLFWLPEGSPWYRTGS